MNPVEEHEIGESGPYRIEGGDEEIIAIAQHELKVEQGEVAEAVLESEEYEDNDDSKESMDYIIQEFEKVEHWCIKYGTSRESLNLSQHLRSFRIHLRSLQMKSAKQHTLDEFFRVDAA